MGYDLHIEREDVLDPITREEWFEFVASDTEMKAVPPGRVEVTCPDGSVLGYDHDGFVVWTAHPRHEPDRCECTFWYRDGRLTVTNPDDDAVEKIRKIAGQLRAVVVGDEGETY